MMPLSNFENLPQPKKDRITAALLTEFSDHSLAEAQVARIVTGADIARGAFYKYFADLTDAYQYLYGVALTHIHHEFGRPTGAAFNPDSYYEAVASFVDHVAASPYDQLIKRHYRENESLLPTRALPEDLPVADWAAMTLSHATIKEIMLQPDQQNTALARFRQALTLLAG